MRRAMTMDAPGKILLGVGIVLVLLNATATLLTLWAGAAFLGLAKAGLWLLGAYALVGATVAVGLGARRGKANRPRGARRVRQ